MKSEIKAAERQNSYEYLNKLPAEAFLDPDKFRTDYDVNMDRCEAQYLKGLQISSKSKRVGIAANGTWFADLKDGSLVSSYEGIGYHAYTSDLLKGFLDGNAEFVVYRYVNGKSIRTVIKESK